MSSNRYVLPNTPASLYESANKALRVLWEDRFRVHHCTMVKRVEMRWEVCMFVQVHYKKPHSRGWTGVNVSVHVSESLTYADASGPIIVEVRDTDGEDIQSVIVWKYAANFDTDPLDAYGKLRVLDADRENLKLIESLVSR